MMPAVAEQGAEARTTSRCTLEAASFTAFAAFALLAGIVTMRVAGTIDGPLALAIVLTAAAVGLVAAELVCGLVHWACDTFLEETTPVLGPTVIYSFREHHRDPLAMTRRGFFDVNSHNCLAVLPLLAFVWWQDAPADRGGTRLFAETAVLAFAVAAVLTNQFHMWAHAPSVPPLVQRIQRAQLILSPALHARHHSGAHRSAYCVTFGWLNGPLDRIDFFGRLERGIRALGGTAAPIDCDRRPS